MFTDIPETTDRSIAPLIQEYRALQERQKSLPWHALGVFLVGFCFMLATIGTRDPLSPVAGLLLVCGVGYAVFWALRSYETRIRIKDLRRRIFWQHLTPETAGPLSPIDYLELDDGYVTPCSPSSVGKPAPFYGVRVVWRPMLRA